MKKILFLYDRIFLSLALSLMIIAFSDCTKRSKSVHILATPKDVMLVNDTSIVNQAVKEREKRIQNKENTKPKNHNSGSKNQERITYQKMKMGGGIGDTIVLPISE